MSEKEYITNLISQIEAKLQWGNPENWSHQDFDKLSELIQNKTGLNLSNTTLKRVWGKVEYKHSPTVTTLSTLAQFIDFADWRTFKQAASDKPAQESNPTGTPAVGNKKRGLNSTPIIITAAICILIIGFWSFKKIFTESIHPDDYKFEINKVISTGVPNSAIFTYDASKAPTDSVFIVQTWDIRRKTLVPKDGKKHSAIYYYPGFFRTKLIVDNTVVKTADLQIATDGWLALIETPGEPIYFKKEDFEKDSMIAINAPEFEKYHLPLFPTSPKLRFFNQRDLGELRTDDFTFETTLRNDFNPKTDACPKVEVLIQCKDDILIIELGNKACSGELHLTALGKYIESKYADLSGFGTDLHAWTHLEVRGKGQILEFLVNQRLVHTVAYPNIPSGIVGVQYRFSGPGAIRDCKFTSGKSTIVF